MSKEKIIPCCNKMAEIVTSQVLGVGAYLPEEADSETANFASIHLFFRSVVWQQEQKLGQLLHDTDIECLVWTRLDINFCPFCGYDWRRFSKEALDALRNPQSPDAIQPAA